MAISEETKKKLADYENRIANGGKVISTKGSTTTVSTPGSSYNYKYTNNGDSPKTSVGNGTGYSGTNSAYGNRETAYTWSDGSTTYSNYTNYKDAAREAGKGGLNLVNATTYRSGLNGKTDSGGSGTNFSSNGYTKTNQTGKSYDNAMANLQLMKNYFNLGELGQPTEYIPSLPDLSANYSRDINLKTTYNGYSYIPEYDTYYEKERNPYRDMIEEVQSRYDEYEDLIREQNAAVVKQGVSRLKAQKNDVTDNYEESAKQAYVNYLKQQHLMPEFLSSQGITGGATETAQLSTQNSYQNNLSNINNALNKAIYDIDNAIVDLRYSGDIKTAQQILENSQAALSAYQNIMQNAINYDYQVGRDYISDMRYNREYGDSQRKYNDSLSSLEYDRMLNLISMGFSPAKAADTLGLSQTQIDMFVKNINDNKFIETNLNKASLDKAVYALNSLEIPTTSSTKETKKVLTSTEIGDLSHEFPEHYISNGVLIEGEGILSLSQALMLYDNGNGALTTYVNPSDNKIYFKKK